MAITKSFSEFTDLVGEEIAGVCFVRDYVQILFDGPMLSAKCGPMIELELEKRLFPEQGSRDLLCSMINSTVTAVEFDKEKYFLLCTSRGHRFTVELDPVPPVEHECLTLKTPGGRFDQYW
ncbi:MAG: hypothetical protein KIT16_13810 [Rhodospirillaceae bacterium]|nr:hypothetical protein [Rhodospirillaceae bacterium]